MRRLTLTGLLMTALLTLGACASQQAYRDIVATWQGKPETLLIQQWGVPDRNYTTNGQTYLVYEQRRTDIMPGHQVRRLAYVDAYGNRYYDTYDPFGPRVVEWRCETTFTVADGVIQDWSFRGNSCVAHPPR